MTQQRTTTAHGVLMEILGQGVLLTGDSGAGKSELALELVARGHRLVADDAPLFSRLADGGLEGRCAPLLQNFLEVRGLGIVNVRRLYGDAAVAASTRLALVLHLETRRADCLDQLDRLRPNRDIMTLLGGSVPRIILAVAAGRPLATLGEVAVRSHLLSLNGYDAIADFTQRQRASLG